jgi:glutathione S-transferase
VRDAIDRLGLDIELRDIQQNASYREELRDATGRETVPVLRIESGPGEVHWLAESLVIIDYLEREGAGA